MTQQPIPAYVSASVDPLIESAITDSPIPNAPLSVTMAYFIIFVPQNRVGKFVESRFDSLGNIKYTGKLCMCP